MWCLSRLLPLMIGDRIPKGNQRWENFLQLLEIMDIIFAPVVSTDDVAYLHTLIEEHHQAFIELYSLCSIIPKMHYMIHYPEWILRYLFNLC